jgi:aspartyl/asparaginyl beta-hydroxylase (cupin superfamily)
LKRSISSLRLQDGRDAIRRHRSPEHCGQYKGVIRYRLGLIVPKPESACRIRVGNTVAQWEEGKACFSILPTLMTVWSDTDDMRVIERRGGRMNQPWD